MEAYLKKISLLLLCFIPELSLAAPASTMVQDIKIMQTPYPDRIDIKLIFSDNPTLHYFTLKNSPRFVVDIPHGRLQNPISSALFYDTPIKTIRLGSSPKQGLRMVFDLNSTSHIEQSITSENAITFQLKFEKPLAGQIAPTTGTPTTTAINTMQSSSLAPFSDVNLFTQANRNNAEIKFTFSNKLPVHYFILKNPDRLVVDIKNGRLKNQPDPSLFVGTAIKSFRQGSQPSQILRLVFNLNGPMQLAQSTALDNNLTLILRNKEIPAAITTPPDTPPAPPTENAPVTENRPTSGVTKKSSASNLNVSLQEDSLLGPIAQMKSSLANEKQAAALELDSGPRVVRANGTYGFAINEDNRVKITAEYLLEDLDFSFYSGDTRQWVDQGAIGADYQYLLNNAGPFKSLEAGGHYSHAPSKNLSEKTIAYADGSSVTNYRRIAGGDDWNGMVETSMKFWPKSLLIIGGDYDKVRYDTENCIQDGHNAQGLGGHIRLQQLLNQRTQLEAQSTLTQLFNSYGAQLNWIWKSNEKMSLSTGINSSYTEDHTTERKFWTSGINLNIVWDDPSYTSKGYVEPQLQVANLGTWTQTPAVRMPDVLAITDECVKTNKKPFSPVQGNCPSGGDVQFNGTSYYAAGGWYQSYLQSPTPERPQVIAFDSANIIGTPSGEAACLYILNGKDATVVNNRLILKNKNFNPVKYTQGIWYTGAYSQYWPSSQQPTPNFMCPGQSQNCLFETVEPG